jgi:hypothetical protein
LFHQLTLQIRLDLLLPVKSGAVCGDLTNELPGLGNLLRNFMAKLCLDLLSLVKGDFVLANLTKDFDRVTCCLY